MRIIKIITDPMMMDFKSMYTSIPETRGLSQEIEEGGPPGEGGVGDKTREQGPSPLKMKQVKI